MPYTDLTAIQDDILSAVTCGQEGQEKYPELVLSSLDIVSRCLTNMEEAIASVTSSTMAELDDLFASLDLESSEPPTQPSCAVSPSQWLLDNLHNPYPPVATKRAMEESPELGSHTVNQWFARARQRIGWTRLLRDRFDGCRSAATDAAFRAFVRDDPRFPLETELCAAFMAVKAHANHVYDSSSPEAPGVKTRPSPPPRCQSATPSLTHSTNSEDSDGDVYPPPQKRKRSCSKQSSETREVLSPPRKRRLSLLPGRVSTSSHLLPLPAITTDSDPSPSPSRSRKRRLSESSSGESTVKRPRGPEWAPRKQTVSDPLPMHTPLFDWDLWCKEAFSLPLPVTTNHPFPDALDFELFNFEAFAASQPTDTVDPRVDTYPEPHEQQDAWLTSLFAVSNQTDSLPTSWDNFSHFELLPHPSTLPSLTNSPSPSTPSTQWSLSPPELPYLETHEPPIFDFSSPSMFKIPDLYPAEGVDIIESNLSIP